MEATLFQERRGAALLLTLSNPGKRNALSPAMYGIGVSALAAAAADPGIAAVVITGADGTFCAGGDLDRLQAVREAPPAGQRETSARLNRWIDAIRASPKPVIAAVENAAAGAGLGLALACDVVVAARGARFVASHVNLALSVDGGCSAFVVASLPRQAAAEMILWGRPYTAERLHGLGVVNEVVEPGAALGAALDLAARVRFPRAVAANKRLLESAPASPLADQLRLESESFVELLYSEEVGEALAALRRPGRPAARGD